MIGYKAEVLLNKDKKSKVEFLYLEYEIGRLADLLDLRFDFNQKELLSKPTDERKVITYKSKPCTLVAKKYSVKTNSLDFSRLKKSIYAEIDIAYKFLMRKIYLNILESLITNKFDYDEYLPTIIGIFTFPVFEIVRSDVTTYQHGISNNMMMLFSIVQNKWDIEYCFDLDLTAILF